MDNVYLPSKRSICNVFAVILLMMLIGASDAIAQYYELSLNHRRRYDQVQVELWAKAMSSTVPKLGNSSLIIQYNTSFLKPAVTQNTGNTDSIDVDVNKSNPVIAISSEYNKTGNGYNPLSSRSYASGYYSLEVNLATLGTGGLSPSENGKGSFLGTLTFDIIGSPDKNSITGIQWSKNTLPGNIQIFDADSNNIKSQVTFTDPSDYNVLGLTILSPNVGGQVVDRDASYAALTGEYLDGGYPIYFERSINPQTYTAPVDDDLGYVFQYSLNNGSSWANIGRVAETDGTSSTNGNNTSYRSGEIYNPNAGTSYVISSQDGAKLDGTNYRSPVRVVWSKNKFFVERSEQARLKVIQLDGAVSSVITDRPLSTYEDMNDAKFVLGRLFFMQLNGSNQYLKTPDNFSNSTQLTVETWVNLNNYQAVGTEPGIVVSSGGEAASPIFGSKEGAWMLYLKDGKFPAFRVREIQGRGTNGYMATVVAYKLDPLLAASDNEPLDNTHANNWVHLAATVNNNTVELYVNGEKVDRVVNNNATNIRMLTTNHPLWIGVNPNNSIESNDYLHAGIKSVKVWRVALTQDQIRTRVSGVVDPTNVATYGDLRRGLQYYYSFEGSNLDLATDTKYQNGAENAIFYNNGTIDNLAIKYRPDQPHIRMSTPIAGAGVSNKMAENFEIRWVSYGLGDITTAATKDINIEYSLDNGTSWHYAKDAAGGDLGGENAVDVETGKATWEPYENNVDNANLRTINPYAKTIKLRARGTADNTQNNLMDVSGDFTVASYFALKKPAGAILSIDGEDGMNIIGNSAFLEAWIRPYRFPTEAEGAFPIISKIDSTDKKSHYVLKLMPSGQLQFEVTDSKGNMKMAKSDTLLPLERPNSVAIDSVWTHVGVYIFLNNGTGSSEVRFYIDGKAQRADTITTQLGADLVLNTLNEYPTYIGYSPSYSNTIPNDDAKQTESVTVSGNINSGTPENTTRETSIDIYDKAFAKKTLKLIFTKTATASQYIVQGFVNDVAIPRQSEKVNLTGNVDNRLAENATYNTTVIIKDNNDGDQTLGFTLTKTATVGEFNLAIALGAANVNQSVVTFTNGKISPSTVLISAVDLNANGGNGAFDAAKPKDVTVDLSAITYNAAANSAVATDDVSYVVTFKTDGSINTPTKYIYDMYDLNAAASAQVFDKNMTIDLTKLTQLPQANSLTIIEQDGRATSTGDGTTTTEAAGYFVGDIKEVRFWQGTPNNTTTDGNEPTEMSLYIQGAQSVSAADLTTGNSTNLNMAFSFVGGSYVESGYNRSAGVSTTNSDIIVRNYGTMTSFNAQEPYVKLVEPAFNERVANTKQDVRVRWVGFHYDGMGFSTGDNTPKEPALEFSIRGGGGNIIQPYQFVASDYWSGNNTDAMSFPDSNKYVFKGTGTNRYFASKVDASIADPDENNDGIFTDQGPLAASLTNARFRLGGKYTVNTETNNISDEGPLFTVTPASNFTVRVLLEGYHKGNTGGTMVNQLGTTYEQGGLRIKLYKDNSGGLGQLVGTSESAEGYDDRDPANRNLSNNRFGNVNFVFTDLTDGNYWVVVEHKNHMPIMSRFAATFKYEGDDRTTWIIESGWDFNTWNGIDNNALANVSTDPWASRNFSAFGDVISTKTTPEFTTTGLIYNDGIGGGDTEPMPAMVGGDVDRSGQIDAADRIRVRLDNGTNVVRSDVTGDGFVNADDRTIVDRNHGHISSIHAVKFPDAGSSIISTFFPNKRMQGPFDVVVDDDIWLSKEFNKNAKAYKERLKRKTKIKDHVLAGINYLVEAEPRIEYDNVELDVYITNRGNEFALANCTFAFNYNSSDLEYTSLVRKEESKYHNRPEVGYVNQSSAPNDNAFQSIEDLRTIEIDYLTLSNLPGETVPNTKTYVGTLRFKLKNPVGKVAIKWHKSTTVHSIKGQVVTPEGEFKKIKGIMLFNAQVTFPNGGETLSQNKKYNITWNTNGTSDAYVEYSKNSGLDWIRLEDKVSLKDGKAEWTTPNINTDYGLVRLLDVDTEEELDRSDSKFSIIPDYSKLIRPASGDAVYTGGSYDKIKWKVAGYNKLKFEFTSDAGKNWTVVVPEVDAELGEIAWNVPKITTKQAQMRMIDIEGDQELAKSGWFKILAGSVTFTTPKKDEVLMENNLTRIRWVSSNVELFDLQLSLDGGSNWTDIKTNVKALQGYQNWKVITGNSNRAIIRAIWLGDPGMEYDRTEAFAIKGSHVEYLPEGYEFSKVMPNPVNEEANIKMVIGDWTQIEVSVIDQLGRRVKDFGMFEYPQGSDNLKLDLSDISPGSYYIEIRSPQFDILRKIIIIR